MEQQIHKGLKDHSISPKREFFEIKPDRVIAILKLVEIQDITPIAGKFVKAKDEIVAIEKVRKIKSIFKFIDVDIPVGTTLSFKRDKKITATITGDRHVIFEGEKTSLPKSAKKILKRNFDINWATCRGPDQWSYKNETLTDRRKRLKKEAS